jgi:hypothetical protein
MPLDISYPGILSLFGDFKMKGRTEHNAFAAWFLENFYHLDAIEVDDCICDCPFVVKDKETREFIGVKTIQELLEFHESDARYDVLAWTDGVWKEVHFLATSEKRTKSIGFNMEKNPN